MSRRTTAGVAVLGLALAGGLAGCGGSSGSSAAAPTSSTSATRSVAPAQVTPAQAVEAAYTKTLKAQTMQFAMTAAVATGSEHLTITGSGAVDVNAGAVKMAMQIPELGKIQALIIDKTVYLKLPEMPDDPDFADSPFDKWIKMDSSDLGDLGAASGGSTSTMDPTESLDFLQHISATGVDRVGTEKVRGVETTHYHADIDIAKMANDASASDADKGDLNAMAKEMGLSSVPADIYIDASGQLRRLVITMAFSPEAFDPDASASADTTGPSEKGSLTLTEDFFGFGTPLHVTAPPADQVIDGSGMLNELDDGTGISS